MEQAHHWIEQAQHQLHEARGHGLPVCIEGHGSKRFYGNARPERTHLLSTLGYAGVVNHDPTELVVVARAGTPITELEQVLATQGQSLAFEPPRFGPGQRGTVGGMVATGLSGPARLSAGSCRDALLGMTVLNSSGELLRFGGTVMKNVAGYDMTRLHSGALGTLGVILDVAIKVLPRPTATLTLSLSSPQARALSQTNAWLAQPLPLSATAWLPTGELVLRLSGARAAVESAPDRMAQSGGGPFRAWSAAEAEAFWTCLRDQTHAFFEAPSEAHSLWRLSLPPTAAECSIAGAEPLIEWGGAQRWLWSDAPDSELHALAARHGGSASCFRAARSDIQVFPPLTGRLMDLQSRIKAELDPHHLLEPGRLYKAF